MRYVAVKLIGKISKVKKRVFHLQNVSIFKESYDNVLVLQYNDYLCILFRSN